MGGVGGLTVIIMQVLGKIELELSLAKLKLSLVIHNVINNVSEFISIR